MNQILNKNSEKFSTKKTEKAENAKRGGKRENFRQSNFPLKLEFFPNLHLNHLIQTSIDKM